MCKVEIVNIGCCEIGMEKRKNVGNSMRLCLWLMNCMDYSRTNAVRICAASKANSSTKSEPVMDIFRTFWVKAQNGRKCSERAVSYYFYFPRRNYLRVFVCLSCSYTAPIANNNFRILFSHFRLAQDGLKRRCARTGKKKQWRNK